MQSNFDAGDTDIQCLCGLANGEFLYITQKENPLIDVRKLFNRPLNQIPDLFAFYDFGWYFAPVTQQGR
jgi:hypothetical protein